MDYRLAASAMGSATLSFPSLCEAKMTLEKHKRGHFRAS